MVDPKQKPKPEAERPTFGPHPEDLDMFEGHEEPLADGEAVIRWLEGEGEDPWREQSS